MCGNHGASIENLMPHAFYHVTCRGNDRRAIFRDDHDRTRFLERLRIAKEIFSVRVHAYVLMSNHFHLIVETPKANLSEFMGRGIPGTNHRNSPGFPLKAYGNDGPQKRN